MSDDQAEHFAIAEAGGHVWHIPGADGLPLCGAVLHQVTRRYLPGSLDDDDVICDACTLIYRNRTKSAGHDR